MRKSIRVAYTVCAMLFTIATTSPIATAQEPLTEATESIIQSTTIEKEHATRFGNMALEDSHGYITTFHYFSKNLFRKLNMTEVEGMNANQFTLHVMVYPKEWLHYPLVNITNSEIAEQYNLTLGLCSFVEFFDEVGNYKLREEVNRIYTIDRKERTATQKELLEINEVITMLSLITHHDSIRLFPNGKRESNRWYALENMEDFEANDAIFVRGFMKWYINEVQKASTSGNWQKADEVLEMLESYQLEKCSRMTAIQLQAERMYNNLDGYMWCIYTCVALLLLLVVAKLRKRCCHNK